jgi:hypothetical protein
MKPLDHVIRDGERLDDIVVNQGPTARGRDDAHNGASAGGVAPAPVSSSAGQPVSSGPASPMGSGTTSPLGAGGTSSHWAHARTPQHTGGPAHGVLRTGGGGEPYRYVEQFKSGEDGPGRWLKDNLPAGPGSGMTRAWTHVEGHAAGYMHQNGITQADLFTNRMPCDVGAAKTPHVLNKLLPAGSTLDVHFPADDGGTGVWRFIGGQPGWTELS